MVTKPGKFGKLFAVLPDAIPELVKIVQDLVIDKDFLELYGETLNEEKQKDVDTRYVETILGRLMARDNRPLDQIRDPGNRFVGSCRDYAIVLCSMLRHKNIPARLRCGFDQYFGIKKDFYDDHWLCEYWDSEQAKWILVDANLDETVVKKYEITLNPLNIPYDKFIVAGEAWKMIRHGTDPDKFGVSSIDIKGQWFVRGSVVRDISALYKWEALPWDYWGIADKAENDFPELDLQLLDRAAKISASADSLNEIEKIVKTLGFSISEEITSYSPFFGQQRVKVKRPENLA